MKNSKYSQPKEAKIIASVSEDLTAHDAMSAEAVRDIQKKYSLTCDMVRSIAGDTLVSKIDRRYGDKVFGLGLAHEAKREEFKKTGSPAAVEKEGPALNS